MPLKENEINENSDNLFEIGLGYLKNNETFTKEELRDILENLHNNVNVSAQHRIMDIFELFGIASVLNNYLSNDNFRF